MKIICDRQMGDGQRQMNKQTDNFGKNNMSLPDGGDLIITKRWIHI